MLLVHGMGQQTPMETLRTFVDEVWAKDPEIEARDDGDEPPDRNPIWLKPDTRTGSLELSRITTRGGRRKGSPDDRDIRTDFYEFYWADLTEANTLDQLQDWLNTLILRWRSQVPQDVLSTWYVLWGLTIGFALLSLWSLAVILGFVEPTPYRLLFIVIAAALYLVILKFLLATFGDVARYVRAQPANVAARRQIRERGLGLLQAICRNDQYERVVLVGHSLGCIVAYDLLKFYWSAQEAAREMRRGDPLHAAFAGFEQAADALTKNPSETELDAYRAAQRAVFDAMRKKPAPTAHDKSRADDSTSCDAWLISDFVTIGCPLTHAEFLLARDKSGWETGKLERRFPTSPPVEEKDSVLYRPQPRDAPDLWKAHHAAPFAAVTWTNIYDPASWILGGDIISGPLRENFGPGIRDIPVRIEDDISWLPRRFFTHTKYWSAVNATNPHLTKLRKALDLLR